MKPEFDLIGFNRDVRDLENIPFAVCLLNLDGTYAYANPAYLDLVGVAEAGFGVLAGSPFDCGLADPTENEEMRRALVEALHRGEEYAGVARVRGGDTDSRKDEVFHRISARRLDEGRLLVLTRPVLSEHDILLAERDQEIERLARWRSEFLQNSPSLVIVHDLDGIISFANAAAEEALGEGPGELVGRDLGAFVTPAHLARYLEYLEQLERRPSTRGLLEVRGAYGTTRSWRYQSSVSIDGEDPPAATAQIVDVTNEVQLLQALQESELRLHRLVAADPRPIWITDQTGLCVFANDAAIEITSPAWTDPAGVSIDLLLPGCVTTELLATGTTHIVDPRTSDMRILVLNALDLGDNMIRIAVVEGDENQGTSATRARAAQAAGPRASVTATLEEMRDLLPEPPDAVPLAHFHEQIEYVARQLLPDRAEADESAQGALVPVAAALLRYWGIVDPPDIEAIWQRVESGLDHAGLDKHALEPSQILRPVWPGATSNTPAAKPPGATAAAIIVAASIVSSALASGDGTFQFDASEPQARRTGEPAAVSAPAVPVGKEPPDPHTDRADVDLSDHGQNPDAEDSSPPGDETDGVKIPLGRTQRASDREHLGKNIWEIAGIDPETPDPGVFVGAPDGGTRDSEGKPPPEV